MSTLAKHMIVAGAENRPPMLDKSMYDSWQSRMLLYIKGKKNGRMMLESKWTSYDCDVQATNIVLQGLPPDLYSLVNHCKTAKAIWDRVELLMQGTDLSYQERECKLYNEFEKFTSIKGESLHEYYLRFAQLINDMHTIGMTMQQVQLYAYLSQHEGHANDARLLRERYPDPLALFPQIDTGLAVPVFLPGDDPIACLNKATKFMSTVVASRFLSTNNQLRTSSNPRNQATIQDDRITVQQVQGRQGQGFAGTRTQGNATSSGGNNAAGQARVVKCYNCQGTRSWPILDEEQLAFLSDLRIPYGRAIQTTIPQNKAFQTDDLDAYDSDCDDISSAKAVLMANLSSYGLDVLSEIMKCNIISYEQYLQETQNAIVQDTNSSTQQDAMIMYVFEKMSNQVTNCNKIDMENKRVNESLTAELERYKEQVKTFKQRFNVDLSSREKLIDSQMDDMIRNRNALKQEVDSLKQTLSKQVKEKESLLQTFPVFKKESKEKEHKNINKEIDLENKIKELDNIVYKKAQWIKPTLHDGIVISKKHDVISVVDEEKTLILEEESRSKMLAKQNDPISKEKKINISLINYNELNKLTEDFGKCFVSQMQLSAKQAFWLPLSNPNFDKVVKVRTTPDAITEGLWGFEHTKKVFIDKVIPFINSLRATFKDFDNVLYSELNEVKTVFNQMEATVKQCFINKKYFDIQKKELSLDNDRLLDLIICQDVMNIVMHDVIESKCVLPENDNRLPYAELEQSYLTEYSENLKLKAELARKGRYD
ncbi:hypothetical protein Tco_0706575 [Tanacetum coccineum]|uniref:Integrase, catalytic region, zinc finger, CCHC-type, peptidase aspartic, catalytic n=1 Tax=Tanacetum coccineum TaxID=301880 RepID=A0ABQ4Y7R7_9ASTR